MLILHKISNSKITSEKMALKLFFRQDFLKNIFSSSYPVAVLTFTIAIEPWVETLMSLLRILSRKSTTLFIYHWLIFSVSQFINTFLLCIHQYYLQTRSVNCEPFHIKKNGNILYFVITINLHINDNCEGIGKNYSKLSNFKCDY